MGTKVGKQKEGKAISGLSIKDLNTLVSKGGKDKLKALKELSKRS